MTGRGATGRQRALARLAGIGLLGAGVAVALYVAGRLHTPNYNFSLFGRVGVGAVMLKSTLASIALGAAAVQVLVVQSRRLPGWALPVAGGALAVVLGVLWYTSALWYYNGYRLPGT